MTAVRHEALLTAESALLDAMEMRSPNSGCVLCRTGRCTKDHNGDRDLNARYMAMLVAIREASTTEELAAILRGEGGGS